jgi:hypothetical protein
MKKWFNSENAMTFVLTVAAVVVGIFIAPKVLSIFNSVKSKATGA